MRGNGPPDGPLSLLGRGIYDGFEVAHLIQRHPSTVAGWTVKTRRSPPILEPQLGGLFSFLDLVSLYVVSQLAKRGVSRRHIYEGGKYLQDRLGTDRPYAHEGLATVGTSFFGKVVEWVDAGQGGQGAFFSVIEPLLRPIDYAQPSGLAVIWRPRPLVVIDPRIQAGAPCVEGTRVPTAVVVEFLSSTPNREGVAEDFDLTLEQLDAAVEFEAGLSKAA